MNRFRILDTTLSPGCEQNLTSNYATTVLADSPVGYWQCQECFGDLTDNSGNGKTMVNALTSLQTYRVGPDPLTETDTYALETAGGSLYSTNAAGVPTTATNNCSMELWLKLITPYVTQNNQVILYNGQSGSNGWGILLGTNRKFQLLRGGIAVSGASTAISDDVWNHLVLVRDAGTWKFYINGSLDSGAAFGTGNPNTPAVGAFTDGNATQRQTCHMAIYASALSATQVANHYAAA